MPDISGMRNRGNLNLRSGDFVTGYLIIYRVSNTGRVKSFRTKDSEDLNPFRNDVADDTVQLQMEWNLLYTGSEGNLDEIIRIWICL
jgi:hypothetical protein